MSCRVLLWWWCPLGAGGALLLPLFGCVPSLSPYLCPLSRFPFLLCLSNMPYLAFQGRFWRVLGCGCMFVWVKVFALIVGFLCACGVRRLYDLRRVSPLFYLFRLCFISFASVFLLRLSFVLFLVLLHLLSLLVLLSSACPLSLCGLLFLFPLRMYAQKERTQSVVPCVLSCLVVCCFIWLLLYIPRTRQVSTRLYRNKVLEKGNLTECSKLFCARLYSYLCSSKFVLFLF